MSTTRTCRKLSMLLLLCGFILMGCDELTIESNSALPNKMEESEFFHPLKENVENIAHEHMVYIPVYSNILVSLGGRLNLAITLSVRNTDFAYPLIVNKVSYYNTSGEIIESFLDVPYVLEPMASTHFFVTQTDSRGGPGANFIVKWSTDKLANMPVIEAVMAGSNGTQGFSFINPGREIKNNSKQ